MEKQLDARLRDALSNFVLGTDARRSTLSLLYEETDVTETFLHVLWDSVIRNEKRDWAIQIAQGKRPPSTPAYG